MPVTVPLGDAWERLEDVNARAGGALTVRGVPLGTWELIVDRGGLPHRFTVPAAVEELGVLLGTPDRPDTSAPRRAPR